MEIEKQVCSPELSNKLNELGVKQNSFWFWLKIEDGYGLTPGFSIISTQGNIINKISAFTSAELGEILPGKVERRINSDMRTGDLSVFKEWWDKDKFLWRTCYTLLGYDRALKIFPGSFLEETEADSRAKMLIYLIEQGIVEP